MLFETGCFPGFVSEAIVPRGAGLLSERKNPPENRAGFK